MITKKDAAEFAKHYDEIVLDTRYGEIHICGKPHIYEELTKQGKKAFAPSELVVLSGALDKLGAQEQVDPAIRFKISEPHAKIKEINIEGSQIVEVVLEIQKGHLHACTDANIYEQRVKERKAALSPEEVQALVSAGVVSSLKALAAIKAAFLDARVWEIRHPAPTAGWDT